MARIRRTKEELESIGYFKWLEECESIRKKKKSGTKLTPEEKEFLKNKPTVENPYGESEVKAPVIELKEVNFTSKAKFKEVMGGRYFICPVYNDSAKRDEDCKLFCKVKDCPFYEIGYYTSKGRKPY